MNKNYRQWSLQAGKKSYLTRFSLFLVALTLLNMTPMIVFAVPVFMDHFDDGVVAPRYTPLLGSSLIESNGSMHVSFDNVGQGVNIDFSDVHHAVCLIFNFSGVGINDGVGVDFTVFHKVIATDVVYPFADIEFNKVGTDTVTIVKITTRNEMGNSIPTTLTVPGDWSDGTTFRIDWITDIVDGTPKTFALLEARDFIFFHTILDITGLFGDILPFHDRQTLSGITIRKLQGSDPPDSELLLSEIIIDSEHVPEPSTYLLFGTGLLGILGYACRRRQA